MLFSLQGVGVAGAIFLTTVVAVVLFSVLFSVPPIQVLALSHLVCALFCRTSALRMASQLFSGDGPPQLCVDLTLNVKHWSRASRNEQVRPCMRVGKYMCVVFCGRMTFLPLGPHISCLRHLVAHSAAEAAH